MKVIDSIWFTEFGETASIGIVVCYDKNDDKILAFIGKGKGFSRIEEEQYIMKNGAAFPAPVATKLLTITYYEEMSKKGQ